MFGSSLSLSALHSVGMFLPTLQWQCRQILTDTAKCVIHWKGLGGGRRKVRCHCLGLGCIQNQMGVQIVFIKWDVFIRQKRIHLVFSFFLSRVWIEVFGVQLLATFLLSFPSSHMEFEFHIFQGTYLGDFYGAPKWTPFKKINQRLRILILQGT